MTKYKSWKNDISKHTVRCDGPKEKKGIAEKMDRGAHSLSPALNAVNFN